jgi:hypothetical protein
VTSESLVRRSKRRKPSNIARRFYAVAEVGGLC